MLPTGFPWQEGLAWSPGGEEVWVTGSARDAAVLAAVSLRGRVRVVGRYAFWPILHDINRDGLLLLEHEDARSGLRGLAPGETIERGLTWLGASQVRGFSADGRKVAFLEYVSSDRGHETYVRATDLSPAVRLGSGEPCGISPDGRWVLSRRYDDPPRLVLLPSGAGSERAVALGALRPMAASWLPDGRGLLVQASSPGGDTGLHLVELGGGPPRRVAASSGRLTGGISPDGRLAALTEPGLVTVVPLDGGAPGAVRGTGPGDEAVGWCADSTCLFVIERGRLPQRLSRLDLATGKRTLWRELMPPEPAGVFRIDDVVVAPGESGYAYTNQQITTSQLSLVSGLR